MSKEKSEKVRRPSAFFFTERKSQRGRKNTRRKSGGRVLLPSCVKSAETNGCLPASNTHPSEREGQKVQGGQVLAVGVVRKRERP